MHNMTLPRSDLLLAMLQSLLGSGTESMSEYFFGHHYISVEHIVFWATRSFGKFNNMII